jgi:Tol biopolymer transport system component
LSTSGQAIIPNAQTTQEEPIGTAGIAVPTGIRVGSNCSNGRHGCATTNTYSLETYVQDGLDKEWISSWKTDSLKAGAVAYRSYGAWFVANPICPSTNSSCPTVYDICNSIYCQVFNTSSQKSTVAAAQATAGVVLSSDGVNVFFAEYAANTNGLYCPDGQTGQPALNWPCMLDPAATGSTGSGHGRGLSAWGSQYWARGQSYQGVTTTPRDWRCILNHYYNANSNSITVDPNYTGPGSLTTGTAGTQNRTAFLQGAPRYGNIAYDDDSTGPYTIRVASAADGFGDRLLVSNAFSPTWEPGGARLSFANTSNANANWGISIISADGSGLTQITAPTGFDRYGYPITDFAPAWSPLGDRIAFCSKRSGSDVDIWTVSPDGTGLQQVTHGAFIYWISGPDYDNGEGCYLRWSPDGTKIAFTGDTAYVPYPGVGTTWNVYTMNADGSNVTQLTNCQINDLAEVYQSLCGSPSWSPDGTKIAFADGDTPFGDNIGGGGIYTKGSDGSNIVPVFQTENYRSLYPQWSADGQQVIFTGIGSGPWGVWAANPGGTNLVQIIGGSKGDKYSPTGIDCSRCGNFGKL